MEKLISVIMPAYNAEKYIGEAIESILRQTYRAWELLVVDDGSTDGTVEEILKFVDPRIILIKNEQNRGLIYSLNLGLKEAKGKYIARMDADDICFPDRFEKQVDFLEKNPEITILGTSHRILGTTQEVHYPKFDEEIKLQLLRKSAFTHPTVMMRKADLDANGLFYREEDKFAEDYGLWTDVAEKQLKLANLEDVLLDYRHHEGQVTVERRQEQLSVSETIQRRYFEKVTSAILSKEERAKFKSISEGRRLPFRENVLILDKLYRANDSYYKFHKLRFTNFICHEIYDNLLDRKVNFSDLLFLLKKKVSCRLVFKVLSLYISKL